MATMTDESALLAAVKDNLDDDTPRLVYADWVEERGRAVLALFIREQIDLYRSGVVRGQEDNATWQRVCEVTESVRKLRLAPSSFCGWGLYRIIPIYGGDVLAEYENPGRGENPTIRFSRGFLHTARGPLDRLQQSLRKLVRRRNVERAEVTDGLWQSEAGLLESVRPWRVTCGTSTIMLGNCGCITDASDKLSRYLLSFAASGQKLKR